MPVDRELWKQPILANRAPGYNCPRCRTGALLLVKDSLKDATSADAARDRQREGWDPTEDVGRFVALLRCNARNCSESVTVVGVRYTEPNFDPEDGTGWEFQYYPQYFDPPLNHFAIPEKCPESVRTEICNSFRLALLDPSGAAARLRTAIERLLDAQGVRARARKPGKIVRVSLHERIEIFRQNKPELADALMAVKWLGNAGTHDTALQRDDLFDAYDIVEHVVDELISERTARVRSLAKQINKRRGPRTRRQ